MLKNLTIILFITLISGSVFGQQSDLPISPKHKKRLEKIKSDKKKERLLAKFLRQDASKYGDGKSVRTPNSNNIETQGQTENHSVSFPSSTEGPKVERSAKEAAQDYKNDLSEKYNLPDVDIDTTLTKQAKTEIKSIAKDSLDNYIEIPDIPLDSTATEKVKSEIKTTGKQLLEHELGTPLPDVRLDTTIVDQAKSEIKSFGQQAAKDELGIDIPDIKLDSTVKDQVKSEIKSQGKQALEDELGTDIPDITLDSTTMDQISEEAEKRAIEALKKKGDIGALDEIPADSELGQLSDYKKQLEQTQQELQQGLAKQKIKEKMAASAKKFIQENAGQISEVQSKMGELKQKYSYVPNSNDLSTAKKRTSLEGESFWKRLVIGGNFNVSKTNPLRIDLSPVIGYKINKLFEVGVTGAYRTQFKADNNGFKQNGEEVYGFSIFADHMVFKNFFGHLEGERLRTNGGTPESPTHEWKQTLLIGIGRKFNVAKWLEMQALVLYNPLHDNTDGIYNSPVVFKTGIRVSK